MSPSTAPVETAACAPEARGRIGTRLLGTALVAVAACASRPAPAPRAPTGVPRVYFQFEDVPASLYTAQLRGHYGDLESVDLHTAVTIAGIPCAPGEVLLHNTQPLDRCDEGEDAYAVLECERDHERAIAEWRATEGITHDGYVIASCVIAHDTLIDGASVRTGMRISLSPAGHLAP